ncbi:1-acyl-sn-glycerol-3-phosphate acyltransferase [Candidatus Woesearchaeota archaeon]|nr:1-acyl-sn-glycerol-3-phosphate acyltransferase [Candidatus Woesearchaeota archaeon]
MVYPIARIIISALLSPWMGKCTGIENVPKKKGALLAANHASYLDHFVIGTKVVPHTNKVLHFLAKQEHFDSPHQWLWHKYLRAIPLDRKAGGKTGLSKAVKHLKKGDLIMIYPEGTRTLDGKMNKAKTGVARLALAAHVPVIPMGITNTFRILPKKKRFPRRGKADLNIGKPLYFTQYYGKGSDKKVLRKVTNIIMKEIARLSKQEYPHR